MRILVYAVLCSALSTAALEAQPAAVTIISGNGQLTCQACFNSSFLNFDPLVVEVTDAKGNALPGVQVTWAVTSGSAFIGTGNSGGVSSAVTNTGSTGQTSVSIGQQEAQQSGPQFGAVSTITASAGNASATFFESQSAAALNQEQAFNDVYVSYGNAPIVGGPPISGVAGSASPTSNFSMSVFTDPGAGVPNVALFLLNPDGSIGPSPTVPSAYCQTQPGAGNYTTLTNAQGVATCNVAFGPVAGTGTYKIVTGGAVPQTAGNPPDTNFESGALNLSVTAPSVGAVKVISGNNQPIATAGAQLQALVAEVVDASGNPLVGQTVTWAVSPVNAIQLNNETASSDSNGLVKVENPVFSASASGTITVTVTSTKNASAVATFTLTAQQPVTVGSLTIPNGTPQSQNAVEGLAFTDQLAVMVTGTNGQPMSGVTVSFVSAGVSITLSATSTTTNSNGVALVTATAGLTPGTATVTASIGTFSQAFTLNVLAPGPNLTPASFLNGADGQVGSVSPCSIAAIAGSGVAPGGTGLPPVLGPLQYEVATDTVSFGTGSAAIPAPIFSVSNIPGQQQILILVPCEVTPGTVPVTVTVNGGQQTLNIKVQPASPGIFQTTMSDGVVRAVIERPDGTFASPSNPARRGELVTAFVTGLGSVSPQIATNALPIWNTPSFVNGQVIVGVNNEGAPVTTAQLSPDIIGVYYVEFQIPNDAPQNNNVVFSVGVVPVGSTQTYYSAPGESKIPVQ
ncbi:MAG TPA: hypothetical protein VGE89_02770 [Bryobacteraceae bacterium]|jgi:uncharacterized protein (TIGR03437 family)